MGLKTFTFDFSVDAWIRALDIEAESLDEAKDKLSSMTLEDIVDKGHVKSFDITNVDIEYEDIEEEEDLYEVFYDEIKKLESMYNCTFMIDDDLIEGYKGRKTLFVEMFDDKEELTDIIKKLLNKEVIFGSDEDDSNINTFDLA